MPLWLFFKLKQVGKWRERVKIKIIVLIISYMTPNRELRKKIAKKLKKLKNTIINASQAKTGRERPTKSENKNYHSDQFLPDP